MHYEILHFNMFFATTGCGTKVPYPSLSKLPHIDDVRVKMDINLRSRHYPNNAVPDQNSPIRFYSLPLNLASPKPGDLNPVSNHFLTGLLALYYG